MVSKKMTDDERWYSHLTMDCFKIKKELLAEFFQDMNRYSDGGSWAKPYYSSKDVKIFEMEKYFYVTTLVASYPWVRNQLAQYEYWDGYRETGLEGSEIEGKPESKP